MPPKRKRPRRSESKAEPILHTVQYVHETVDFSFERSTRLFTIDISTENGKKILNYIVELSQAEKTARMRLTVGYLCGARALSTESVDFPRLNEMQKDGEFPSWLFEIPLAEIQSIVSEMRHVNMATDRHLFQYPNQHTQLVEPYGHMSMPPEISLNIFPARVRLYEIIWYHQFEKPENKSSW